MTDQELQTLPGHCDVEAVHRKAGPVHNWALKIVDILGDVLYDVVNMSVAEKLQSKNGVPFKILDRQME